MRGDPITVRDLAVRFSGFEALSGVTLDVAPGEFLCLLGPSGCGKSTLLNVIAGFVPALGLVEVGGRAVTGPGADRGVVFQSSEALFPWLSVTRNVSFGLRLRGLPKGEIDRKVDQHLRLVGLAHAAGRFPSELSGGMRQRAQIARVLVNEPAVVLMDEPFGALDAQTRSVLQQELTRIWEETRPTVIFVTHDVDEALLLGDKVVTMTAGPAATIKDVFPIAMPRPRTREDPRLLEMHRQVRENISAEVRRTMQAEMGP